MDAIMDAAAALLLAAYHLRLVYRLRSEPLATVIGSNRAAREKWLAEMCVTRADLLVVQSLRNWTITGTFLASTAILIGVGITQFVFTQTSVLDPALPIASVALGDRGAVNLKLLTLASLLFTAFFCFAQMLRLLNHLIFAIPTATPETQPNVLRQLHQGAYGFTLGMRAFFLCLPCALWLFGSVSFLAATIVLLLLLRRMDYVPATR